MKVVQSCLTVCDPMDCTVHGILQARGWPFPCPGESFQPRDRTWVSCIAGRFFISWATREAQDIARYDFNYVQGYNLFSVIQYSHPHVPTPKGLGTETLCFPLNCNSPALFPPAPNPLSTSCLCEFHSYTEIWVQIGLLLWQCHWFLLFLVNWARKYMCMCIQEPRHTYTYAYTQTRCECKINKFVCLSGYIF